MKFLQGFGAGAGRPGWCVRWLLGTVCLAGPAVGQTILTWPEVLQRFENDNPTLKAARAAVDESKANEVTAYLRPNPDFTLLTDGTQVNPGVVYRPFAGSELVPTISYLHERQHKRELRRDSAHAATAVTESQYADQERSLLFMLRTAFVQVLQAKAVLQNAQENLAYWDKELEVNRQRYKAGDMALLDLNRLELQRVQFESDLENALVNLRTNKIQLMLLMNQRTPIEQFDVRGPYEFAGQLKPLEELHAEALDHRPDLKAAIETVDLAKVNYKLAVANGSTDPTFSGWWTNNPSFANPYAQQTLGLSVGIPLRIFDRNQGEKERTRIDIGRSEQLRNSAQAQVFNDVDSAYWTLVQAIDLLKPYKSKYLALSEDIRNRMAFSFKNGGASLLDFLDSEKSYRDTRLAYLTLIGSYMTAAAQLNAAVGAEVIP